MQETHRPAHCGCECPVGPGLIAGVIFVALGAILLLDRFGILYAHDILRYWPVILIAIGVGNLLKRDCVGSRVGGAILTVVGGVLLLDRLDLWHVRFRDLWPLVLIAIGMLLLWRAIEGRREPPAVSPSGLNEWAMFGGVERRISSQEFEGGKVSAVFGGVELDLRQAAMKGNQAVIEAHALFGGVELRIPADWTVTLRGVGLFGAYADHTQHPAPAPGAELKELVVRGSAVLGGVEVRN